MISPKRGRAASCSACFARLGLNAACGWLFALKVPEPKELPVSNDVDGLLCGDLGCPGLLFCSFAPPDPLLVGLLGGLLFPISRRYFSLLVRTVNGGCTAPGVALRLNLLAISLTVPGVRDDGRRTGWDLALLSDLLVEAAGPDALLSLFLVGERDGALCVVLAAKEVALTPVCTAAGKEGSVGADCCSNGGGVGVNEVW